MVTMSETSLPPVKKQANPYLWSFTTYFTEGFPYTIIRTISSVFFRDRGMSVESIGLTSLFGLPWILKFLWGPVMDCFGTKRKWLLITQGLLVGMIVITALLAPLPASPPVIALLFFLGSFIAATHDTAIDGFYMEALDKEQQAKFLGYRVMAYRIAMMTGTGIIVTIGATIGWGLAFLTAAGILALFYLYHLYYLPVCEKEIRPLRHLLLQARKGWLFMAATAIALGILARRAEFFSQLQNVLLTKFPVLGRISFPAWIGLLLFSALFLVAINKGRLNALITKNPESFYTQAFLSFMERKDMGKILAFIILIRTGEFMLSAMASPFLVDLGIKVHYGWISAAIGLPGSILGAMVGGWLIARYSLGKMIWPFLIAQNITNIIYMLLAFHLQDFILVNTGNPAPSPLGLHNMLAVVLVHGFDQLAGGLGTAVLMTFLMRICLPGYKAAHYAIGTGLMSVSGLVAGVLSGFLTAWAGYGYFFGISFLLSIPGMVMVFFIPCFDEQKN